MICVDENDEILDQGQESANFHNTHDLINVNIKAHVIPPPPESFTYRKYITPHNVITYLETCNWAALLSSDTVYDLESGLNCLSSNLQMAIGELAPLKTVKPHKENRSWIGTDLQFTIRKCEAINAR